jgi:DNA-binding transcriptional regulator YiaG
VNHNGDEAAAVLAWRNKRNMTQPEAAEWYGCSEREWRRWERREVPVPRPLLKRIKYRSPP